MGTRCALRHHRPFRSYPWRPEDIRYTRMPNRSLCRGRSVWHMFEEKKNSSSAKSRCATRSQINEGMDVDNKNKEDREKPQEVLREQLPPKSEQTQPQLVARSSKHLHPENSVHQPLFDMSDQSVLERSDNVFPERPPEQTKRTEMCPQYLINKMFQFQLTNPERPTPHSNPERSASNPERPSLPSDPERSPLNPKRSSSNPDRSPSNPEKFEVSCLESSQLRHREKSKGKSVVVLRGVCFGKSRGVWLLLEVT